MAQSEAQRAATAKTTEESYKKILDFMKTLEYPMTAYGIADETRLSPKFVVYAMTVLYADKKVQNGDPIETTKTWELVK